MWGEQASPVGSRPPGRRQPGLNLRQRLIWSHWRVMFGLILMPGNMSVPVVLVCQGINHALRRSGVTYKKNAHASRDVRRRVFQTIIKMYEHLGRPLVYIDASGFVHDMPRTHGSASTGQRCDGLCDWQAGGRTNAIGALIGKTLLTVGLFQANVTADIFTAGVKKDLLPRRPENPVIVMDNATFHKCRDTQNIIQKAGHTLLFLPPWSPDLNPIEQKWAHPPSLQKTTLVLH